MPGILERIRAIDTDTHITEPPDVWTSRVSKNWGDAVPHVRRVDGRDVWFIRDQTAGAPGFTTQAGFDGSYPDARMGFDDIPRASFDAKARLEHMDAEGIWAQVLYPNVGGFGSGTFLRLSEPALMLECVRAYNDFLVEWSSADLRPPDPRGRHAVLGRAGLRDARSSAPRAPATAPCSRAPSRRLRPAAPVRPSLGSVLGRRPGGTRSRSASTSARATSRSWSRTARRSGFRANYAPCLATVFMQNANCISDLIFGGVCHRFPDLKLVSVESGVGWMQSFLEACDWQWTNGQVRREHPEYDLLPSEYFRRQIYACFWFEEASLRPALDLLADNLLWETDYPHPTCQHPGQTDGWGQHPRDYAEQALRGVSEPVLRKVLHDNAAALYGLD